jgi:hypothetical protein
MANWTYNANDYTARNFELIPEGDHRVRIKNVIEKVFSTGNEGFEITLDVPGYNSKLWYYLILDPTEPAKTNQRLGMFFDSFNICDFDLSHFENWIERDGAVRVKHNIYNGSKTANVLFCLSRSQQSKLVPLQSNPFVEMDHKTIPSPKRDFNGFDIDAF